MSIVCEPLRFIHVAQRISVKLNKYSCNISQNRPNLKTLRLLKLKT